MAGFDKAQTFGKEQLEAMTASSAAVTKGWQSIAAETSDYTKKSFEKSRELAETHAQAIAETVAKAAGVKL